MLGHHFQRHGSQSRQFGVSNRLAGAYRLQDVFRHARHFVGNHAVCGRGVVAPIELTDGQKNHCLFDGDGADLFERQVEHFFLFAFCAGVGNRRKVVNKDIGPACFLGSDAGFFWMRKKFPASRCSVR